MYNIKIYITIIHIQYKNIQLLSADTVKHSYDSSYSLTNLSYLYRSEVLLHI